MKRTAALLLCLLAAAAVSAGTVEGTVYFKDGTTADYTGADRIVLPKKRGALKAYRNYYRKNKTCDKYSPESIDSIVCWAKASPQHTHTYISLKECGWVWQCERNDRMAIYIYSPKGYSIQPAGGAFYNVRQRTFSQSKGSLYVRKASDDSACAAGRLTRSVRPAFREALCRYVADDEALCERIRRSGGSHATIASMLMDYAPAGGNDTIKHP